MNNKNKEQQIREEIEQSISKRNKPSKRFSHGRTSLEAIAINKVVSEVNEILDSI